MNYILALNWKMNPVKKSDVKKYTSFLIKIEKKNKIIFFPPALFVSLCQEYIKEYSNAFLGVQNIYTQKEGAYTGEVSAAMAKEVGVKYVLIGHSERRAIGETDEICAKKLEQALFEKLTPILCIGEKTRDLKGVYIHEIESQIKNACSTISASDIQKVIFAYEPVWAIGKNASGVATPEIAKEISILVQRTLSDMYTEPVKVKILYGGSVNEKNARDFLIGGGMDGVLVGRVSLDPKACALLINSI